MNILEHMGCDRFPFHLSLQYQNHPLNPARTVDILGDGHGFFLYITDFFSFLTPFRQGGECQPSRWEVGAKPRDFESFVELQSLAKEGFFRKHLILQPVSCGVFAEFFFS